MHYKIKGKVIRKYGNNIDTDIIIPSHVIQKSEEPLFFAKYAFESYDSKFRDDSRKNNNNIIVAGNNFGCGSSRENAVFAIQYSNVIAIIAQSYSDIFYRNALNNGLIAIIANDTSSFERNDELEIFIKEGLIKNITKNKIYKFKKFSNPELKLIKKGGIMLIAKEKLKQRLIKI